MRKIENAVVDAMQSGQIEHAAGLLGSLIRLDRRRAWWALFRCAAARQRSEQIASVRLVSRSYIARRTGRLVGVGDEQVLPHLITMIAKPEASTSLIQLTEREVQLLGWWLPARITRLVNGIISPPRAPSMKDT